MTQQVSSNLPLSGSPHDPDNYSLVCDRCLQVSIAVATLATACFTTLAALHYFTVVSALIASATGICDAALIAGLSCKKCVLEEHAPVLKSPDAPQVPDVIKPVPKPIHPKIPLATPPIVRPPIVRPPNQLTDAAWAERMQMECNKDFICYNLCNPACSIASNPLDIESTALPMYGNYKAHYSDIIHRPMMAVRLPTSQLAAFPQAIQDLFQADPDIELYFFIYSDPSQHTQRNLILHYMAMPEYDLKKKEQSTVPGLLTTTKKGLACNVEVGIYDPKGLADVPETRDSLAENTMKPLHAHFHPTKSYDICISPDNCIVNLAPDTAFSSFYTAARFRGRSIAFYTLLIKDLDSQEGKLIQQATGQKNLTQSLDILKTAPSPCAADVQKLFAYYS